MTPLKHQFPQGVLIFIIVLIIQQVFLITAQNATEIKNNQSNEVVNALPTIREDRASITHRNPVIHHLIRRSRAHNKIGEVVSTRLATFSAKNEQKHPINTSKQHKSMHLLKEHSVQGKAVPPITWKKCNATSQGYHERSSVSLEVLHMRIYPTPVVRDSVLYVDLTARVVTGTIKDVTIITSLLSQGVEVDSKPSLLCDLIQGHSCPLPVGTYSGTIGNRVPSSVPGGIYIVRNILVDSNNMFIDCVEFEIEFAKRTRKRPIRRGRAMTQD